MSLEANKDILRRFFAAAGANDQDAMLALVAPDSTIHTPVPGSFQGPEGARQFLGVYFGAFPEQRTAVHELVAEGDRVLVRHTHHVTHGGDFAGLPPTGKQAVIDGLELFRIADGKIAEMWHQDDLLGLMIQLGAVPAPGQPPA
jgi:steroid delta-isomerase-like uncharacterized protein